LIQKKISNNNRSTVTQYHFNLWLIFETQMKFFNEN